MNNSSLYSRGIIRIITTSVIVGSLLVTGCSGNANINDSDATDLIEQSNANVTQSDIPLLGSDPINEFDPINELTPTPVSYDFQWTKEDSLDFSNYVKAVLGDKELGSYLMRYGFTPELNVMFTNYVNAKFNKNYDTVPFYEAGNFRAITLQSMYVFNNYHSFYMHFMRDDMSVMNAFNNRLVMSYLIQNEIPFGTMVPLENLKALQVEDMYNIDVMDVVCDDLKLGSYDSNYSYSNVELYSLLVSYNMRLFELNTWYGNDSLNAMDSEELCALCNSYFAEFHNNDTLQMGKVLTKDDFAKLFPGYEMNDISYIPGAIYDPNENYPEIDPTQNVINGTIDENLLGEWTTHVEASGFTYIYQFNDDFTGVFTTTHPTVDLTTGQSSEQSGSVDFTYTIEYGILKVTYNTNGNTVSLIYQVKDGVALFNGVEYTG